MFDSGRLRILILPVYKIMENAEVLVVAMFLKRFLNGKLIFMCSLTIILAYSQPNSTLNSINHIIKFLECLEHKLKVSPSWAFVPLLQMPIPSRSSRIRISSSSSSSSRPLDSPRIHRHRGRLSARAAPRYYSVMRWVSYKHDIIMWLRGEKVEFQKRRS